MKHPSPIRASRCWPDEELQRRLRDLLILSGDPRAMRATVSFGPAFGAGTRQPLWHRAETHESMPLPRRFAQWMRRLRSGRTRAPW